MTEFKVLLLFPRVGRANWDRVSFTTGLEAMAARPIVPPRTIPSIAIGWEYLSLAVAIVLDSVSLAGGLSSDAFTYRKYGSLWPL
jgi:hypothetical protein